VFWVISVYFNIRNTLPKSGTFLLGHPVYLHIYTGAVYKSIYGEHVVLSCIASASSCSDRGKFKAYSRVFRPPVNLISVKSTVRHVARSVLPLR